MNGHRTLPPGDCGMQGVAAGGAPRRGRAMPGTVGLVGGVEDHSSDGRDKNRTATRSVNPKSA
jgi:hypothetical protein